jgi:hypothetical protein
MSCCFEVSPPVMRKQFCNTSMLHGRERVETRYSNPPCPRSKNAALVRELNLSALTPVGKAGEWPLIKGHYSLYELFMSATLG